jgi:serine carboxypeptidase-like clade 2
MMMQIGNALMDDETDQTGMVEYAWDHAVISDRVYADVKAHCNFSIENATDACNTALDEYFAVYNLIDMYSLYTPVCTDASLSSAFSRSKKIGVHGAAPKIFSKHVHNQSISSRLQTHYCGSTALLFLLRIAAWVVHEAGGL